MADTKETTPVVEEKTATIKSVTIPNEVEPVDGTATDPLKDAEALVEAEKAVAEATKAEAEAKAKEEEEAIAKAEAEAKAKAKKEVKEKKETVNGASKEEKEQHNYITKILNINPELTPTEAIRYQQIIENTGFTPAILLDIIKNPDSEANKAGDNILLSDSDLIIVAKALASTVSKNITGIKSNDFAPDVWALIEFYGVILEDLREGVKALEKKCIKNIEGKIEIQKDDIAKIVVAFEELCVK